MFKTPSMAIGKQLQAGIFTDKEGSPSAARFIVTCEGHNTPSNISEKHQALSLAIGNRATQQTPDGNKASHRAGVSFCFSKKAQLKLESSASVFNENSEETTDGKQSHNLKVKPAASIFRSQMQLGDDAAINQDNVSITSDIQTDDEISINMTAEFKILKEEESILSRATEPMDGLQTPNFKKHFSDVNGVSCIKETEKAKEVKETERSLETNESCPCQTNIFYTQQNNCNKHSNTLLMENPAEFPSEMTAAQGQATETECNADVLKTVTGLKSSESINRNMETPVNNSLINGIKPKALSFLHVVSKDGNTALQWPTELVLFTKTQPSISYGCNPLYFDFKLSRNSKTMKGNESINENSKDNFQIKTVIENEASGLILDEHISFEKDNQSTEPKTKCSLNNLSQQNVESCTQDKETNWSGSKDNSKPLKEHVCSLSPYFNVSESGDIEGKMSFTKKRKICLQDHFPGEESNLLNRVSERMSFPPSNFTTKKRKVESCDQSNSEDKIGIPSQCKSNQKQCDCCSDVSGAQKDSTEEPFSYKSSSYSRHSGCDSDGCSSTRGWRLSCSQRSSSGRHSTYSETSISSSTASYNSSCLTHRSSDNVSRSPLILCCKRRHKCTHQHISKHGKHRYILTSEEEADYLFQSKSHRVRKCEEKSVIRNQKHKRSKKSSQHRGSHKKHRSKWNKSKHRIPRGNHSSGSRSQSSERSHSRQTSGSETSSYRRSKCHISDLVSKEKVYCSKTHWESHKETGEHPSTLRKGEALQSSSLNNVSCFRNGIESLSENVTRENSADERASLKENPFSSKGLSKKDRGNVNALEIISEDSALELYNPSKTLFSVELPPSVSSTSIVPLLEKLSAVNTECLKNCEVSTLKGADKKAPFEESQEYKLTVTTHTDYNNCHFKDIIRIGAEHQSLSTETQAAIQEQSSPLISQVKPFIQSCDPLPNDFPCALPSNRYSVVTDSTETKEEQIRLELHDVNMNSSPMEEQLNYYYDSTVQNYGDSEHVFEVFNKSSSPPLSQQPITFSPDEIDKYRLLQLQAQQHMHTQLLAKHIKVLPASGPAAYSTTPALQPVPVQQHTSITTIHHTLLQRCALSATMHSHNTPFPLAHVHPLSQAHFTPITFSHFAPAVIPTHTAFLTGQPLHLFSATAIHPGQLTLQTLPHTALIPTLFTPHLNTGASSAIHFHPLIHPLLQGQDFHHSGPSQTH